MYFTAYPSLREIFKKAVLSSSLFKNVIFSMNIVLFVIVIIHTLLISVFEFDISNTLLNKNYFYAYIMIFVLMSVISGIFVSLYKLNSDSDKVQRSDSSEREIFERRVLSEVDRKLNKVTIKDFDFSRDIKNLVEERIDRELISSIDEALRGQVSERAKINRVIDHMDLVTNELKIRLEGPASRAETSATWARRAAYFMAVVGLLIAVGRVAQLENVSGSILNLYNSPEVKSIWPYVTMHAAPWVGLILLVEFTALLFLRFSNRATALQRYFTEGLAELRDRHLAMRTIIEFGTPEQVVIAARSMIIYGTRVLDDDKDAATIAAASNMMGNFTDAVKSAAEKMGGKSGS